MRILFSNDGQRSKCNSKDGGGAGGGGSHTFREERGKDEAPANYRQALRGNQFLLKLNVRVMVFAMGMPNSLAGSNFHLLKVSRMVCVICASG